ncbi:Ankyrin-1 [Ilyonectria robusta]
MEQGKAKFRVYLVGFPTAVPDPGTVPVVEMIRHILPEASVVCHDIFRCDVDIPLKRRDEDDADELSVHSNNDQTLSTPKLDGQPGPGDVEAEQPSANTALDHEKTLGDMADDDLTRVIGTDVMVYLDDLATVSSVAIGGFFTPGWIDSEAYSVLERIQKETPDQNTGHPSKVLLAGYGFGGMVVKQAIVNANANPMFYDVAYNAISLVFFAMPHQPTDQQTWEELLLGLIRSTTEGSSYRGRLSGILPDLVESVSHLSQAFFRVETKYDIKNIVPDDAAMETSLSKKSWTTVQWPDHDLAVCNVEDVSKMKLLRSHFAPSCMLSDAPLGMLTPEEYTTYFHTLQALSPSRRIVDESRTLDEPDDFNILKDIYGSLLRRIPVDYVCGSSIQVVAPKGYGKSAIVKLISQHIRRESSVVVIENFPNPLENHPKTFYGVIISFIHQIISQKPSLFCPIRNLMTEMLRQSVWTEQAVKDLLSAILLHSRDVNFLVVVYNLGSPLWPAEVREWWSGIPALLEDSFGCTCTFLISNDQPVKTFSNQRVYHIDLQRNFAEHKEAFISAKTNQLLDDVYGLTWRRDERAREVKQIVISKAKTFGGSFREISAFLVHLLQGLSRVAPQAIRQTISRGPQTTEELYNSQARLLKEKDPRVYSWATTTLSWVGLSVRQLHVQELAAAVAVHLDQRDISEIGNGIFMHMERDVCSYTNGLVAVENGYARIPCPSVRAALDQDPDLKTSMLDDYSLARICLHYLKIVLGNDQEDFWEKCLSSVSPTQKTKETRIPEVEFLDYATRYWPTHCLRVKQHNELLENDVVNFLQSKVAERWFQLYLLCHGLPPNLLSRERDDTAENDGIGDFKPDSSGSGGSEGTLVRIRTQQSVVEMASFIGLAPVLPALMGQSKNFDEVKTTRLRRGCLDHEVKILNNGSKFYLDCAILDDDVSAVAALLEADEACVTKHFPLHVASLAGSSKMVWVLLETLEDTTAVDKDGRTALHMAAISGRVDVIQMLVGEDENTELAKKIDTRDANFETPLLLATRMRNVDAVRFLAGLNEGQGISVSDKMGKTPVHHAVLHCPEVLDTFFTYDPNALFARDRDGSTLLHIAARFRSVYAVCIILQAAKDPEHCITAVRAEDNQGKSPLDYASENGFSDVVGIMVTNMRGAVGADALIQASALLAAEYGHLALLETLSEWTSGIKNRLLSAAVNGGHLLVVKHLLDGGAFLDGEEDADMEKLIALGAKINHGDSWAREVASGNLRGRRGETRLFTASHDGDVEAVKKFLKRGADPNICRDDGWSPLHAAADNREICEALVANGAKIDYQLEDDLWTPLQFAASWGCKSTVEFFLQHGADTSHENVHGSTPLHLAVAKSYCDIVQVMVDHEGDNAINLDNQGAWGEGPIHMATEKSAECVRKLLKKGVNVKAKTVRENISCLVLALQAGMGDTFAILLGDQESGAPEPHWDHEDLVSAYWVAIQTVDRNLKSLKLLVNKEPWLLDEVSAEGYNGLETYMRSKRPKYPKYEEQSISIAFLDFGFNPFTRRGKDLKSAFELGFISRREANMTFMERCIKDLPKDIRASGMGFRELRIATEFNDKGAWEALKSLREDVGGETDQDDWNIDHFLYQSEPRLAFADWKGSAIERNTRSPMYLVHPQSWWWLNQDYKTRVKILDNGLGATFESEFILSAPCNLNNFTLTRGL